MRYSSEEIEALEMLNSGFLKVYQNINKYDPAKAALATWIRTIIVRSAIDIVRKKSSRQVTEELVEDAQGFGWPAAVEKMNAEEILSMVRMLPPATQAVFNLYNIEGYNHKEIAVMLSISEGTSRWHLSEGRKKLQEKINRMHKEI